MLSFEFTQEQDLVRQTLRSFARERIAPILRQIDDKKRIPEKIISGLTSSMITKTTKKALHSTRDSIDLFKVLSQIEILQKQLDRAYRLKHTGVAR